MKRYFVFYFLILSIPLFLGLVVWQSNRFISLEQDIKRLEEAQAESVEENSRLIADIAGLSSPERIEEKAKKDLLLRKIPPEDVLQIRIAGGGKGHGF